MNKYITTKKALSIRRLGFLCFLFSFMISCSEHPVYEKNTQIENHLWYHEHVPEFKAHITNTDRAYDVLLNLRHSTKYKFSNLSLIIQEIDPKQREKTYPLDLRLADDDGLWKGVGTGNILAYQVPIIKKHHFPDTGMYTFRIKQNMRINPLPKVLDIGILITISEPENL